MLDCGVFPLGGRSWLEERWPKLRLPSCEDSGFSLFVGFAGGPGTELSMCSRAHQDGGKPQ